MAKYVAAVDQGTTSTRCIIFDRKGRIVGVDQKEHEQIYPKPGWVEHDPMEIWERTQEVIRGAIANGGIDPKDIAAVGVTNQRETTVVWNRHTGEPYYNAIVWQDTRTKAICDALAADGGQDRFRAKTGLPLATYFSGPKVMWLLDNIPGLREDAEKGDALFGNIDTWLIWNLTGGPNWATRPWWTPSCPRWRPCSRPWSRAATSSPFCKPGWPRPKRAATPPSPWWRARAGPVTWANAAPAIWIPAPPRRTWCSRRCWRP